MRGAEQEKAELQAKVEEAKESICHKAQVHDAATTTTETYRYWTC